MEQYIFAELREDFQRRSIVLCVFLVGVFLCAALFTGCDSAQNTADGTGSATGKGIATQPNESTQEETVETEGVRVNIDADNAYLLIGDQVVVGTIFINPKGQPVEFEVGCDKGFSVIEVSAYQTSDETVVFEVATQDDGTYAINLSSHEQVNEITVMVETTGDSVGDGSSQAESLGSSKSSSDSGVDAS